LATIPMESSRSDD